MINWLFVALAAVLVFYTVWGFKKGLLRVLYSIGKWALILVFLAAFSPAVTSYLNEHTSLPEIISTRVEQHLIETGQEQLEKSADQAVDEAEDQLEEDDRLSELGVKLPPSLIERVPKLTLLANETLEETGVYSALAQEITAIAMKGLAALIIIAGTLVLLLVVDRIFHLIERLPGIREVNRLLGVAAGALKGMLIVELFLAIVAVEAGTTTGAFIVSYIYESAPVEWLYENNLVLSILLLIFF